MTAARLLRKSWTTARRLARSNALRVPVLCLLFGALVMIAVVHTREPPALFLSDGVLRPNGFASGARGFSAAASSGLTGSPGSDDPVTQFSKTRVGQLLFASSLGDNCRRVLFDNQTGNRYEVEQVFCGQEPSRPVEVTSAERIQALRKSFQKER